MEKIEIIGKIKKVYTAENVFPELKKVRQQRHEQDIARSRQIEQGYLLRRTESLSTDWLGRRKGKIKTNNKKYAQGQYTVPGIRKPRTTRKKNAYIRFVI